MQKALLRGLLWFLLGWFTASLALAAGQA